MSFAFSFPTQEYSLHHPSVVDGMDARDALRDTVHRAHRCQIPHIKRILRREQPQFVFDERFPRLGVAQLIRV